MNERSFVSSRRDLRSLVLGQALGAFNDNLFKTVVSLLAVGTLAGANETLFLSLTGIVFMAPYLLFSVLAGALADRISKRDLLLWTKVSEVGAAVVAAAALALGSLPLMLLALFLLATQAAVFSPAKYGILPEIVTASRLPTANGMLELTRYGAVILGTALGGILTALADERPGRLGPIFVAVALLGVLAMAGIARTDRGLPGTAATGVLRRGLTRIAADRRLRAAVAGMTFFEFAGALLALDLLIVGDEVMGLGEAAIGGLGAAAGIGVGAGAWLSGWVCRGSVRLALAPLGALGVGVSLILMWMVLSSPTLAALALALGGAAGGFIVVPLNAWI